MVGYIYAAGEEIPDILPGVAEAIATAPGVDSPASPSPAVTAPPVTAGGAAAPGPPGGGSGGRSSPNARRLARELNIDLAGVTGTGPGGRITREDVAAVAEAAASAGPTDTAAEDLPAAQVLPLRGMRKTIATRMHESLTSMAQLTMDMDVVMGRVSAVIW